MLELTISQVSGVIAAGIYALQFFIPTATTLILAALLTDQNNLMSWTQAGRALHSSQWPLLVRGDSDVTGAIDRTVKIEGIARPLILGIVGIAAIVTPLGLYDAILPESSTEPQPFGYQKDTSPFGYSTPPRSELGYNRICGNEYPIACPGSNSNVKLDFENGNYSIPGSYNITVPRNVSDLFHSGLDNLDPTVSSIFDIEWRMYGRKSDKEMMNGSDYSTGSYRQVESLILEDDFGIVEGLIIDHVNGGVGFRNHTTPPPLGHGAKWSEDLLFTEPQSMCIGNNITLDFTLTDSYPFRAKDTVLTDRGGFTNLNTTYPLYNLTDPQDNPDLLGRAYKAAYLHNGLTMMYLNVTNPGTSRLDAWSYVNSTMNRTYPIDLIPTPDPRMLSTYINWNIYEGIQNLSTSLKHKYPNPYDINAGNYSTINTLCQGAGPKDNANISNIGVACGMVLGTAQRTDKPDPHSLAFEAGSRWSVPMYSCAAAARAVIKTVDFEHNGTDGLNSLSVTDIRKKSYQDDDDKPLWAVENPKMKFDEIGPIWGLVSDSNQDRDDISVVRQESLLLPGLLSPSLPNRLTRMNMPAAEFHLHAFSAVFGITGPNGKFADYSGSTNMAMSVKWQELSTEATNVSRILNNIWTDVVANSVVGTRSWIQSTGANRLQKRASAQEGQTMDVPVTVYRRRVRYNLVYGIPAFIALFLTVLIAVTTCGLSLLGKAGPSVMRKYLFYTAPGRILATYAYPGQVSSQAPTNVWNEVVGQKKISLASPVPTPLDPVMMGTYKNAPGNTTNDPPLLRKGNAGRPPSPAIPSSPNPYRQADQDDYLYPSVATPSFSPIVSGQSGHGH